MDAKESDRIRWLRHVIVIVGILLTVLGFYSDHWERSEFLVDVFAPDHDRALAAYRKTLESGSEIGPADEGFAELAPVFSKRVSGSGDLTIDRIKITKSTGMQASGLSAFQTIRVEVTVRDGRSAEEIMKDSYVRQLIREHYLEDPVFRLSRLSMFSGIGLVLLEHFFLDSLIAATERWVSALCTRMAKKQAPS